MRLLTNIPDFPAKLASSSGVEGETQFRSSVSEFLESAPACDAILVNCSPELTYGIVKKFLIAPSRRKPVVALDLVLRRPLTPSAKLTRPFKKLLLSKVDYFIHYFRDWSGYERYFGIGPDRSTYVPFKSDVRNTTGASDASGDYVLCLGRSERDYDTFIKSMAGLPYPAAIPAPDFEQLSRHSSRFTIPIAELPANISILQNDDSIDRAIQIVSKASLVVLPIVAGRLSASGIGTYLMAMLLGKCVIITEGPGSSDVLTDEALFVKPEDPAQLATTIKRAMEDRQLREKTALAGREYAERCGNSADLYQRVFEIVSNLRFTSK
jgi:glycosyltransferase involved in cell wall biosynthesis